MTDKPRVAPPTIDSILLDLEGEFCLRADDERENLADAPHNSPAEGMAIGTHDAYRAAADLVAEKRKELSAAPHVAAVSPSEPQLVVTYSQGGYSGIAPAVPPADHFRETTAMMGKDGERSGAADHFVDADKMVSVPPEPTPVGLKESPRPWRVVSTRNGEAWLLIGDDGEKIALANCTPNAEQNLRFIAATVNRELWPADSRAPAEADHIANPGKMIEAVKENLIKRIEFIDAMRFRQNVREYTDRERWQLARAELGWALRMFDAAVKEPTK